MRPDNKGCVATRFRNHKAEDLLAEVVTLFTPGCPCGSSRRFAVLGELGGHDLAGVLTATVAVEDGLTPEPNHRQRIGDDIGRHPRLVRPTDDLAVEQIQLDGSLQP